MTKVFLIEVNNDNCENFSSLIKLLSADEQEHILRKSNALSRKLSLLGHLKVLEEASKYYGEDIGSLKIVSDGKPYLYKHPDFYFNISHSRSLLAVAVSNRNIGIDCEEISKIRNVIVEKRFTIVEKEYICESDENFTNIWTRKEAYFKFTGEGILGNFQAVDTLSPPYSDLLSTKKYGNYIVSLCCENPAEAKVEVISENDIIQI